MRIKANVTLCHYSLETDLFPQSHTLLATEACTEHNTHILLFEHFNDYLSHVVYLSHSTINPVMEIKLLFLKSAHFIGISLSSHPVADHSPTSRNQLITNPLTHESLQL